MQNRPDMFEYNLDKTLMQERAFGKPIIFCNLFTCKEMLKISPSCAPLYKGHKIYINPFCKDYTYKVIPLINIEDFIRKHEDFYEYTIEEESEQNAE